MAINVLLVRWAGGFREVVHASAGSGTRREGFLSLNAHSVDDVDRLAGAVLDRLSQPSEQVKTRIEPATTIDQPYTGFLVGDYVSAPNSSGVDTLQRVRTISVEEDEDGEVTFAPELRDRLLELDDRLQRSIKRMANGSLQGRTEVASPSGRMAEPPAQAGTGMLELPPFYWDGALAVDTSGPYPVPAALTVTSIVLALTTAGSATTTVTFRVNGTVRATMNLASGVASLNTPTNIPLSAGEVVTVAITAAGAGATDLTVCARLG